ncbi:phosphatidylinositol phosphate synthase [Trueperella bialowiezensis]|uniref:Phosphatidylinositol phosphate synthase n=1 Tax=Trueperella bialowiezensis TaxID=312285 RepID=A0A3S4UXT0_9ACTO|nr:CDP-alcohol phosphatidyltransferase family protein [Trueperella bialowiezensis]VEI12489.1 CDP-diacylglycerol--inositol 3-phosphatidyltransferase [Trueperella bialowiezensis]
MLSSKGRPLAQVLFGPIARLFIKLGISANTVTVVGGIASSLSALFFFPQNMLLAGTIITTILVIFDNLDGQIARLTGTTSKWGAFLDSSMDRVSDGAIFAALALWGYWHADEAWRLAVVSGAIAACVAGSIVPYVRARAEGVGYTAAVGIAERADRLVAALVLVIATMLGAPHWVIGIGLWILAVLALITVIQRMVHVYRQMKDAGEA